MLDSFLFSQHIEDDEEIRLIVHRHWLIGCKHLIVPTLTFVALWALLAFLPNRYIFYVVAVLAVVTAVWWLRNFFDYYLDTWIVTDQGIIDLAWHGWFHRSSSRILYSDIQGVSYEIQGVLGTVLRFGTISVEKISSGTEVSLSDVGKPRTVESVILDAMEQYLFSKNLKDASTVQEILAEFVAGSMQRQTLRQEQGDAPKKVKVKAGKKKEMEEEDDDDDDDL